MRQLTDQRIGLLAGWSAMWWRKLAPELLLGPSGVPPTY